MARKPPPRQEPAGQCELCLLGDIRIWSGATSIRVPEGSKRLLALLGLHRRWLDRKWTAGVLWPDGSDERAVGNLRSSIWRLKGVRLDLLDVDKACVKLTDTVTVDVDEVDSWAGRIMDGSTLKGDLRIHPLSLDALDLLPSMYDDWVIMCRERLRHRVLHALEALSLALSNLGRHHEAVEAAIVATRVEPLRDSAQRALMAAHLAEGNWIEAQRSCQLYVNLLHSELGIDPPGDLREFLCRPWQLAEPVVARLRRPGVTARPAVV